MQLNEVVEAEGHLIDSHIMEQIFDKVVEHSGRFEVELFATEPVLVQGRSAVLAAALLDGQTPVAGANVFVLVNPPSGPTVNLTLRDDGGPADGAAGDGLYCGEFTPDTAGTYHALAVITGTTVGGVSFTRETAAEFSVINPPSRLAGTAPDHGVDDNGDGLLDRVVFDVATQTTTAGHYRAFVHLKTAGGQSIVGSSDADLQAGAGTLPVSVGADQLRATSRTRRWDGHVPGSYRSGDAA